MAHTNGNKGAAAVIDHNGYKPSSFFKQDLGTCPLLETNWEESSSAASLDTVYKHVMTQASACVDWYMKAKRAKKWCARLIRIYAIMGGAVAAALPTLADMFPNLLTFNGFTIKPGGGSALILGTIAALLLLDRFFGISSGWVRFTRTQLQIRQIAQEFQVDWEVERASLQGKPPKPQHVSKMLARCKTFVIQINSIVRDETDIWIQEFQEALRVLDDASKPKAASSEPGALNLTVAGGDQSMVKQDGSSINGWLLTVDDGLPEVHQGSQVGIGSLLPGRRVIKVEGEIGEQVVKVEKVINVPAGGICTETLKLS